MVEWNAIRAEAPGLPLAVRYACLDSSPIAAWITDSSPAIVWANQAGADLWQAPDVAELLTRDISDMSETTRRQTEGWRQTLASGERDSISVDWTIYPHGEPTHLTLHLTLAVLDDGNYALLSQAHPRHVPVSDELVRNAEAVRHISAVIALVSPAGEILSRNPAAIERFGRGSMLSSWFDDTEALEPLLTVADTGLAHTCMLDVPDRDGTARTYRLEARRSRDVVSGNQAVLIHMLDESARVGAERQAEALTRALELVEAQEQRWRVLVDSAPDLIVLADRTGEIAFANRGFGADTPAVLVGQTLHALLEPGARAELSQAIERALASGAIQNVTLQTNEAYGVRDYRVRIKRVDSNDASDAAQVMLIARDITDDLSFERKLRHSHKMDAVGTLASGIAHEFNNIMTVILGACDMAEIEFDSQSPASELFFEVAVAAERAASLTRQLLGLGQTQAETHEAVELNELIRGLDRLLSLTAGPEIKLGFKFAEAPCWIRADPSGIEQALINLCLNSVDAMQPGGQLRIVIRSIDGLHKRVTLEVRDTGEGMTPEVQARMFEPFFTTKPVNQGSGLGLATVHNVIEQCGGDIEVVSQPGRGTSVRMSFPAA